jgi:two-component system NtrC family response regulator
MVAKAHLGRGREPGTGHAPAQAAPVLAQAVQFEQAAMVRGEALPLAEGSAAALPEQLFSQPLKDCKEAVERSYMEALVRRARGDVQRALEASGLSRSHLYALLKKWGLSIESPGVGS